MPVFTVDVLSFERSREIDRKKDDWPRMKPVSSTKKLKSSLFSALSAYANEAVRD